MNTYWSQQWSRLHLSHTKLEHMKLVTGHTQACFKFLYEHQHMLHQALISDIFKHGLGPSNTKLIIFSKMLLPGLHSGGQAAGRLQRVPMVLFWLPADRQVRLG